jgi:transcriptional regulator with XRE-family HTH domain
VSKLSVNLAGSGCLAARDLIEAILGLAKEKGIDQLTLARRAGISAESLSRLKRVGGCRLSTALDLARAAGFGTLEISKPPCSKVAASIAARKLSAGRRLPIGAAELVQALRSEAPQVGFRAHLCGFFEELPIELVHDVSLDEELDYEHLVWLAKELGMEGETLDWLTEMAGDGLAGAA